MPLPAFRIRGLSPQPFAHLFGLTESKLAEQGVVREVADDSSPGFPDRVSLAHAAPGETLLLLNYEHQSGNTPYRSRHAIYVREKLIEPFDEINVIPEVMRVRLLSLRAFDARHMMIDADVIDGSEVESLIEKQLSDPDVSYIQAHFARRGCYAARIELAE
jgi:hypothetical protein